MHYEKACNLVTFKTGKLDSNAAEEEGKYPFFTCAQTTYRINSYAFDTECVLLAGNNAGGIFPLKYYKGKFNAYQRTYVIQSRNPQVLNIKYLYFYLRPYLKAFEQEATGATTKFLTLKILNNLRVALPPVGVQEKTAAVLSAYDDLIENNRRRIELLERMTEELYREWFVRFRFPGYQQAKFEKTIPQGWEPKMLGDLCHLIKRGITPKYSDDSPRLVINQRCIRNGGVDLSAARQHDTKVPTEKIIQHADVLINSTGVGTLGRVSVVEFEPNNLTCDTHVTICRANAKKVNPYFLACTVARLQQHFENLAVGSTGQTELGREEIAKVKILLPPEHLQAEFAKRVSSFWMIKIALTGTLKNLAEQRDQLLTRLISGKLPVDQLDIQFPPSMREADTARQEVAHA